MSTTCLTLVHSCLRRATGWQCFPSVLRFALSGAATGTCSTRRRQRALSRLLRAQLVSWLQQRSDKRSSADSHYFKRRCTNRLLRPRAGAVRHPPVTHGASRIQPGRHGRAFPRPARLRTCNTPAKGWSVLARRWPRRDLLCGSILLSGRLLPEHGEPETPLGANVATASDLRDRRAWASHGNGDGVTPQALARASLETAARLGLSVRFVAHSGGHEIPNSVLKQAAAVMESWLAEADTAAHVASS